MWCFNLSELWWHISNSELLDPAIHPSGSSIQALYLSDWFPDFKLSQSISQGSCHLPRCMKLYLCSVLWKKKKKDDFCLQISEVVKLRKTKGDSKMCLYFIFHLKSLAYLSIAGEQNCSLVQLDLFSFAPVVQRQKLSQQRERKPESTFTNGTTGSSRTCKMIMLQSIVLCDNMICCLYRQLLFTGSTKAASQLEQGYLV